MDRNFWIAGLIPITMIFIGLSYVFGQNFVDDETIKDMLYLQVCSNVSSAKFDKREMYVNAEFIMIISDPEESGDACIKITMLSGAGVYVYGNPHELAVKRAKVLGSSK